MRRPLLGINRKNVGREALAGVPLLAISAPLNIGYAQIAGLPPFTGLYALIVPTAVFVLFVSSRQVVASPDAAAAALVASSLDVTGAEALAEVRLWLQGQRIALSYSRLRPALRARLTHFGLLDGVSEYSTNRDALTTLRTT